MPVADSAGIGAAMRLTFFLWLLLAGSLEAKPIRWPWNSRANEQNRLNAATAPKPTSREESILRPDVTKEFNPSAANFGSGRTITGKSTSTGEFHFVDRTRTKNFNTGAFATKEASGTNSEYATKSAQTKESWFARLTGHTKAYATRENSDSGKKMEGHDLPGSEKKFVARGRRQAALDKSGAAGQMMGGDRESGQSWSGDLKPLSIQDVKTLLNKN